MTDDQLHSRMGYFFIFIGMWMVFALFLALLFTTCGTERRSCITTAGAAAAECIRALEQPCDGGY